MRYMLLIYTNENATLTEEQKPRIAEGHLAVMQDAARRGILKAAEPLAPTSAATTVRLRNGKAILTDGPFAETKEQLAGYYILDCENLDQAIEFASRIPTSCGGGDGCVEIRPIRALPVQYEEIYGVAATNA